MNGCTIDKLKIHGPLDGQQKAHAVSIGVDSSDIRLRVNSRSGGRGTIPSTGVSAAGNCSGITVTENLIEGGGKAFGVQYDNSSLPPFYGNLFNNFILEGSQESVPSTSCHGVYIRNTNLIRFNPHYHCVVLEGGIGETGSFHHIPLQDTAKLAEVFRRRVIKLFVEKRLLDRSFALKLLSWKHSGFSMACIPAGPRGSPSEMGAW